MAKRMIVMLAVTFTVIALLGLVKFRQIQTAMAQGASFQPPPEAVTTVVAQTGTLAGDVERNRDDCGGAGVTVSADLPGTVARVAFESGRSVRRGMCWPSSIRGRSWRNSPRSRRNRSWPVSITTG